MTVFPCMYVKYSIVQKSCVMKKFIQSIQIIIQKNKEIIKRNKKLFKEIHKKWLLWRIFVFINLVIIKKLNQENEAGNSGMPLSANLLKLESSILPRAKRAWLTGPSIIRPAQYNIRLELLECCIVRGLRWMGWMNRTPI